MTPPEIPLRADFEAVGEPTLRPLPLFMGVQSVQRKTFF